MEHRLNIGKKIKLYIKSGKILYELDNNARQSYSQIGRKVGLSKDAVNLKIKNMEKSGLIKGYYTVIDVSKLGFLNFRVFVKLFNLTPKKEKEIIDYLKKHPNVGWLVKVSGNWDLNMLVWQESPYEYEKFWNEFLEKYGKYVSKNWVSIITRLVHYKKNFLIDSKKIDYNPEIVGGDTNIKVDEIDLKILKILSNNARASLVEIANKTNLSAKTINHRIKRMIKDKVILSFRALLNLDLLGIKYYKVHLTLKHTNKERYNRLLSYSKKNPNIVLTDFNVGGADFEMEIYVFENKEFTTIIEELKQKFSDIITDIESLEYSKEYKWSYIPIKKHSKI